MLHNLVPTNSDLMTRLIHFQQLKNVSSCFLVLLPLLWEAIALWLWLTVLLPVTCCLLPGVLRGGWEGREKLYTVETFQPTERRTTLCLEKTPALLWLCSVGMAVLRAQECHCYRIRSEWVLPPAVVPGNGLGPWMKVTFPFPRTPSRGRGQESCLLVCCWGDKCFVVTVVYLLTKQGHKHGIFTEEPLEVKSWPSYFTRQ